MKFRPFVGARFIAPFLLLISIAAMADNPPQRIVSIAPSFTEILFALGAGNRVVGTTNFCDYPREALKTKKIGDLLNPNLEEIIALHPDLVILGAWKWQVPEKLRSVRIPVLEIKDAQNVQDVLNRILMIGEKIDRKQQAGTIVSSMRKDLEGFRARTIQLRRHPTVFMELDLGNWTVGSGSYLNEILELAGLSNIFGDRKEPYLMVTTESIASRNPDLILSLDRTKTDYRDSPDLQTLNAVREGRILDKVSFDWNEITRQSPRMTAGIKHLIEATRFVTPARLSENAVARTSRPQNLASSPQKICTPHARATTKTEIICVFGQSLVSGGL